MQKQLIRFAGISGGIAVTLGAMAAHYLKSKMETGAISPNDLQAFETASRYQIYHSIVLLAIAFFYDKLEEKSIKRAAYCFITGIILFSGSLYLLSTSGLIGLGNIRWLGPVTPVGGLFLIAGWVLTAFSGFKIKG
jgi:uncharacterized membrane protein YgdD (TMEM256/DUF423 family)